jgi:hypothetical protein
MSNDQGTPALTAQELTTLQTELAKLEALDQVKHAAEFALKSHGALSDGKAMNAEALASYIYDTLSLSLSIARTSFFPYLSNVAHRAKSAIVSKGRGRNGGYYLSSLAEKQVAEQSELPQAADESEDKKSDRESALYPILVDWLVGSGFRARETSAMRALGRWSNPDVTGVKVSEHLGRMDIEIATIEAKRSLIDWERAFFEAVAHRRFANRAYFAFPLPESSFGKIPPEMRYYSELYDVGVLTVVMPDKSFKEYSEGTGATQDEMMAAEVFEVLSARRSATPMEQQRRFCEAVQITDLATLMTWGG